MKIAHETQTEMDLTASERELARTLASLSPTVTAGVASVPGRELALRAGAARSKQRLRYWQAGSVLMLAGVAAAFVMQSSTPPIAPVTIAELPHFELDVDVENPEVLATLTGGDGAVYGRGQINAPISSGPLKIVFLRISSAGELFFEIVPRDWEVCDH